MRSNTLKLCVLHRWLCVSLLLILVLANFVLLVKPVPAYASAYGRGAYGDCSYHACEPPVIITTSGGLKVIINLSDKQVIPRAGYVVIITPLNNDDSLFKEARIYLEGSLVATVNPDADGTARWSWYPSTQPGTHIKIDVVDIYGAVVSHDFTVLIGDASSTSDDWGASASSPPNGSSTNTQTTITETIGSIYRQLERTVRALPPSVVGAFPYFLFLILGANLLILFLHFHREVRAQRTFRIMLERARLLADQKQVFLALASHYLRTPITVLIGGIDLLKTDEAGQAAIKELQSITNRIQAKIEALLTRTRETEAQPLLSDDPAKKPAFWRQLNLILPIALIGVILVLFNTIALNLGKISHAQVQLIAQLLVFTGIIFATYQIFRRRYLNEYDRRSTELLLEQATSLAETHDALMSQTVQDLGSDLETLRHVGSGLSLSSTESKYITQGIEWLQSVTGRFATAEKLKGIHANSTATTVQLGQLLRQIRPSIDIALHDHGIELALDVDLTLSVSDPELLAQALQHLLDNAIAYSHRSGTVTVRAATTPTGTDITVHDDGDGVPVNKQPLIFQPLYKAEGAFNFNHEGMGFSLYLDKLIMTYLGGTVSLNSIPGKGTTVTLHLAQT